MKLLQVAIFMLSVCKDFINSLPKNSSGIVESKWSSQGLQSHVDYNNLFDGEDHLLSAYLLNMDRELGRNCVATATQVVLEELRDIVINGNRILPSLDPLLVQHLGPFIYSIITVRAAVNIYYLELKGLRTYLIDSISFDSLQLTLEIKITVPWLIISGTYDASAWLNSASQLSGGNFKTFVSRLQASIYARLGTNVFDRGHLVLRELDIKFDIQDIQIQVSSMVGSASLNKIISFWLQSRSTQSLLNEVDAMNQSISQDVFDIINGILSNITIDDILNRVFDTKIDD